VVALLAVADRDAVVAARVYKVAHVFGSHTNDTADRAAAV